MEGRVELVNVAVAETFTLKNGKSLHSAIRKRPQLGSVPVHAAGFANDGVGDLEHHGGPNRAVHWFSAEYYDDFEARLSPGAAVSARPWVGENLTVRGYTDAQAHLGDRLRVGTALLQVSMPTERCGNPGLVSGVGKLQKWMIDSLQTGFYLRVLEPGEVCVGSPVTLVERGHARWSIEALSGVMYRHAADAATVAEVEQLSELAPEWKTRLRVLHARATT